MIRKIKALGIAAVAVLAMSAVVASAANANSFTAASYPAGVHGAQEGVHTFTYDGRVVTCGVATFAGTLPAKQTSLTITPTYEKCHANILGNKKSATVDFGAAGNKCDYLFTSTPIPPSAPQADLVCPAGVDVKIRVYNEDPTISTKHEASNLLCEYTIKAQTVGGVVFDNIAGTGDVTVTNNSGVTGTRVAGTLLNCGKAEAVANYLGNTLVEGNGGVVIDVGP